MYGLVNMAVEGLLKKEHGDEVWQRVCERAEVTDSPFLAMQAFDDSVTFGLVQAAAAELGADAGDLLVAFGRYWVLYVADEGYGPLLDAYGDDFPTLLANLDDMHGRIALSMPQLQPPSFRCERKGEHEAIVTYSSSRAGLCPMVVGLLEGCGERFGLDVKVEHECRAGDKADAEIFRLTW